MSGKINNEFVNQLTSLLRDKKITEFSKRLEQLQTKKSTENMSLLNEINLNGNYLLDEVFLNKEIFNDEKFIETIKQLLGLGAITSEKNIDLLHLAAKTKSAIIFISMLDYLKENTSVKNEDKHKKNVLQYLDDSWMSETCYVKLVMNIDNENRSFPVDIYTKEKYPNGAPIHLWKIMEKLQKSNHIHHEYAVLSFIQEFGQETIIGIFKAIKLRYSKNEAKVNEPIKLLMKLFNEKKFLKENNLIRIANSLINKLVILLDDKDTSTQEKEKISTFFKNLHLSSFDEYEKIDNPTIWLSLHKKEKLKPIVPEHFNLDVDPIYKSLNSKIYSSYNVDSIINLCKADPALAKNLILLLAKKIYANQIAYSKMSSELFDRHSKSSPSYGELLMDYRYYFLCLGLNDRDKLGTQFDHAPLKSQFIDPIKSKTYKSKIVTDLSEQLYHFDQFLFYKATEKISNSDNHPLKLTPEEKAYLLTSMADNIFYLEECNQTYLQFKPVEASAPPLTVPPTAQHSPSITRSTSTENLIDLRFAIEGVFNSSFPNYPSLPDILDSNNSATSTKPLLINNNTVSTISIFKTNSSTRSIEFAVSEVMRLSMQLKNLINNIQDACQKNNKTEIAALANQLEPIETERLYWIKVANLGATQTSNNSKSLKRSNSDNYDLSNRLMR